MKQHVNNALDHYRDLLLGSYLDSSRECLQTAVEKYQLTWDDRPACWTLQPLLIDAPTYRRVLEATGMLARGLCAATERLVKDEDLRRAIGIPTYLDEVLEIDRDHGGQFAIGRFDGYLNNGEISCFEFNTLPWSVTHCQGVTQAFNAMPIGEEFSKRYPFRTVPFYDLAFDALYEEQRRLGGEGPPTLAAIRTAPEIFPPPTTQSMRWVYYLAARGCRLLSATEDEFVLQDGRLFAGDTEVDVITCLTWEEQLGLLEAAPEILDAVKTGAVRLLVGLSRGMLCNYKATFAVLSDPAYEDTFDREVAAALRKHIPWTRMLRDCEVRRGEDTFDLLPHVEDHKEQLIIKPSGASSGTGVVIGHLVDDDTWRAAIKQGVDMHHVVQECLAGASQQVTVLDGDGVRTADHFYDLNPYAWNARRAEGCMVRFSEKAVTNMGEGGTAAPLWILED